MIAPITVLKLGGSLITDKNTPYTFQKEILKDLGTIIKKYKKPLLIVHGVGSFAHTSAQKYGGVKGYDSVEGVTKVMYDASWSNHLFMEVFLNKNIAAVSLHPGSIFYTQDGIIKENLFQIVEGYLRQGIIPVLHGDVVFDTTWKTTIYSGEKVLSNIIDFLDDRGYEIDKIIQLGSTDGYYDSDQKTIPQITPQNWHDIKKHLFDPHQADVTGGMRHKIEESLALTRKGIRTYLLNGNNPEYLKDCLLDRETSGTLIEDPHANPEKQEYVVLVDETNKPLGRSPKLETHNANTPRHRAFSLFLFDKDNRLLLQQRSNVKKTWPLVWSNSVCGHLKEEEAPTDAAKRRLAYELGIHTAEITMALPDYRYRCEKDGIVENEICPVMIGFTSQKPVPNPAEVEDYKWISWKDWLKEVHKHPENYSQWCVEETLLLEAKEIIK